MNTKEKRNRVNIVTVMAVCLLFSPLSQARLTDGESLQAGDYLVQRAKQGQRLSEILSGMKVSQAILRDSETGEAICEVDVTTNPQAVPDFMEITNQRESSSLRPCGGEELAEMEQMALNAFLDQEGVQVAGGPLIPLAVGFGKLVAGGCAIGSGVAIVGAIMGRYDAIPNVSAAIGTLGGGMVAGAGVGSIDSVTKRIHLGILLRGASGVSFGFSLLGCASGIYNLIEYKFSPY